MNSCSRNLTPSWSLSVAGDTGRTSRGENANGTTVQKGGDVLYGLAVELPVRAPSDVPDVRCQTRARHRSERMVVWEPFHAKDIEPSAGSNRAEYSPGPTMGDGPCQPRPLRSRPLLFGPGHGHGLSPGRDVASSHLTTVHILHETNRLSVVLSQLAGPSDEFLSRRCGGWPL
jgi:hypothetical protein